MFDELERIARAYDSFASAQVSVTMKGQDGLSRIRGVMSKLRATTLDRVGPLRVETTSDVLAGTKKDRSGKVSKLTLPPSDVLMYALTGGSRIIARPSGTEPKIKIYFDVREPMKEGEKLSEAEARANAVLEALKKDFVTVAGL
jgi:phosphomannomutase